MLIDQEYKNGNLILSYVDKTGSIKLKYYPWKSPTKFITTSEDDPEKSGKWTTWWGQPVKEIYSKYPNKYSIYEYIDKLPQEEQELLFEYNEPNIFFVDIETEILDAKPDTIKTPAKVLSISIVFKNKILVLGIDPLKDKEISSIKNDINLEYGEKFGKNYDFKYICYKNEYELLLNFFKSYVPKMPVITGWYFIEFDWVYLVNRATSIGIDTTVSSYTGLMREKRDSPEKMPAHRIIIDYMQIYKKWDTSIKIKESESLDFVSSTILKVKKVNYEGNLKILYETDKKKFIYYNAIDSVLVQLIHEKMRYSDILYGIATLSRVTAASALSTLAVTEGILRGKLRDQKNIVLVKPDVATDDSVDSSVKGGWVKEPIRGMAQWHACTDFASLYPFTIRQFNISADSYKGQKVKGKDYALFNGHQIEIEPDDIVTVNGSVFKKEKGVVNQVMEEVYVERKRYKGLMNVKHIELEEYKKELKELEESL